MAINSWCNNVAFIGVKGWFSYNRRYRFDRRCQFKKWSYDWDDYMRTLHKRSFMPAAIGATAIAWIARVLSGRLVADRGDRSDSGDYMRTSLNKDARRNLNPQPLEKRITSSIDEILSFLVASKNLCFHNSAFAQHEPIQLFYNIAHTYSTWRKTKH